MSYIIKDDKAFCPECGTELPCLVAFIICPNEKCDWWLHVF